MHRKSLLPYLLVVLQGLLSLAQQTPNDILTSGRYTVQLCGNQAAQVKNALELLRDSLQLTIQDAQSRALSPAFKAFFKTLNRRPFVRRVLSNIANGTALPSKASKAPSTPTFACVTGPGIVRIQVKDQFRDVYDGCRKNPLWTAIYYSGLNYIFICPIFFSPYIPPQPIGRCPAVDPTTNEFTGELKDLIQFKPYVLFHELAHFYVVPPSTENPQFDIYDWNAAFALKAKRAILNAQSYVLYVASIAARCTAFPVSAVPHSRGRRLGDDAYLSNVGLISDLWKNGTGRLNSTTLWFDGMRVI